MSARTRLLLALLFVAAATCAAIFGQAAAGSTDARTVFAPKMLDPVSGRMMSSVLISIRGDRIESVSENAARPSAGSAESAQTVVLPDSWTVLPGLIDCHTHMLLEPRRKRT